MLGGMMGADSSVEFNISNITLSATFDKDDNMTKMNMKMDVSYDMEGLDEAMTISMDITYDFVNIGTAPTVTAPANADQYTETEI